MQNISLIFAIVLLSSCSTTVKPSEELLTREEGSAFLKKYCSRTSGQSISGDLSVRSSTKEFKGRFSASLRVESDHQFAFEVMGLLGGTVAILKGNEEVMEVISVSKPHLSQKNIRSYMGIPAPLLNQFLQGYLPCPEYRDFRVEENSVLLKTGNREWWYERADAKNFHVPVRLRMVDAGEVKIEVTVESWNRDENYAEKVQIRTEQGELKWSWRSREVGAK